MTAEGKTAIVTGGGKRVGAGIVAALIDDGWTVAAHVRRPGDEVADGAVRLVGDLALPNVAATLFGDVERAGLPPVRLLVNSAARFVPDAQRGADALGGADAQEFDAHMAVNARAPMLLIDELARRHAGGEALVVNITDAKLGAPNPDFLSYTLSKYALAGLTEVAARALAGKGIRVNSIAPALMLPSGPQDGDNFAAVHALNPLRHGVEVDELVAAVRFLIASPGITGQCLTIDGGQRFMNLARDVQFLER